MAQTQPENPIPDPNPNPDPNPDPNTNQHVASTSDDNPGATLKRPREDDAAAADVDAETSADVPEAKRRVKDTNDVIYRIVVPSKQIGKVIGRGGHRIQKVREITKATIKIADAISRHEERVIIISSKDSDNEYSDAQSALEQIVGLILQDDSSNVEEATVGAGHVAANTVRLLIAGCQASSLIGVSGQNIETLRNSSGASITVLSPSQLPPCASVHETDRVVQLSGDVHTVLSAVNEIGCQLRGNPPKQVIAVNRPKNHSHRKLQQIVNPISAEYVTLDIMVPENLVGGLIGKFGANISRIRNESGANIKVYGGKGEQTQRQIHLDGTSQQVAIAKQRVDEYVYAEMLRQAGGTMHQSAPQFQQYPTQQYPTQQPPMPDMSNTLYQGYAHPHGFYPNSNQEAGMMAPIPPIYGAPPTNQAPPYYGYPPYPPPPAPPL